MSDLILVPTETAGGRYFSMPYGPDGIHISSYMPYKVLKMFINARGRELNVKNNLPKYIHIPKNSREAWSIWYHANIR